MLASGEEVIESLRVSAHELLVNGASRERSPWPLEIGRKT